MELLNYKVDYTDRPMPPPLESEGDEQPTIEQ